MDPKKIVSVTPKYIPVGATEKQTNEFALTPNTVVMYCVGFYNTPTAATATDLDLKFTLPNNVEYVAAEGVVGGTFALAEADYSEDSCSPKTGLTGTYTANATTGNSVTMRVPTLDAGNAATMTVYGKIK